jgi:ATPase subunit of ABC transporter with duplicated ATPase domains
VVLQAKKKLAVTIDLDALDSDEPMSLKDMKKAEKAAKKKEKVEEEPEPVAKMTTKKNAKAAALEALDSLEVVNTEDETKKMAKKDLKKQMKAQADERGESEEEVATVQRSEEPKLSAKEVALQRALEMEAADEAASEAQDDDNDEAMLSKKELKALRKKQEKEEAKAAAKAAKKNGKATEVDEGADIVADSANMGAESAESDLSGGDESSEPKKLTLEEKIRKERPPPRIRVMETAQPGYSSLRLEGVGITFRDQEVLKDVTWGVQTGDRIGLVGANGAGKTTQLRILAGELEPTTGDVVKSSSDLRVAMLRQEFVDELVKTRTLKEEFMSVFEQENAILQDLRSAEKELEAMGPDDADKMQEILDKMQNLQNKAENKGVYALEARVKKIMDLMGFTDDEGDDLVASFSGGWKMRIGLGKVLLKEPNILLLDEPTNHLDLESVEWLEEFLRQQNIPMIIVSHDREFLDQVCTKIVDAEGGICREYDGNYSRFLELKKARMDAWNAAYNAQEKKIKEERAWINKFKLKQPQAVKQREAKLEKFMKSEDYVQKPPFLGKPFVFRFPDAPRLSPEVAEVKHLSHAYRNGETENKLFHDTDLFVQKGDRIAVVGPNGSGKSTLLRLMLGREKPDAGTADIVGQNVVANYFEQNQADALDLDKTVIETIQAAGSDQSYNELRALLGKFLFKGDAVDKKVRFLSGGEKARLSLACMMLKSANLLILDEPTNHLGKSSLAWDLQCCLYAACH